MRRFRRRNYFVKNRFTDDRGSARRRNRVLEQRSTGNEMIREAVSLVVESARDLVPSNSFGAKTKRNSLRISRCVIMLPRYCQTSIYLREKKDNVFIFVENLLKHILTLSHVTTHTRTCYICIHHDITSGNIFAAVYLYDF